MIVLLSLRSLLFFSNKSFWWHAHISFEDANNQIWALATQKALATTDYTSDMYKKTIEYPLSVHTIYTLKRIILKRRTHYLL